MATKRNFLLLEVLLALALVTAFAAPLMRMPIKHYRAQIDRLESLECRRIANWTFSEVKELLLKEGIPWEKLPSKSQEFTQPLSDARLILPRLPCRTLPRSFTLLCKGEKEGRHGEIFRIYKVTIAIGAKKNSFTYRLLIQRINS